MNHFIYIVQWSAISIQLFFSGFELAAQVTEHNMDWSQVDWSFQIICWTLSFLIYQVGKLFTSQDNTFLLKKH